MYNYCLNSNYLAHKNLTIKNKQVLSFLVIASYKCEPVNKI